MIKEYTSLGFMSGTSGDGIDASIICSDGDTKYEVIQDKYFEYEANIYNKIHSIKAQINSIKKLDELKKDLIDLENKITLFHAKVGKEIIKDKKVDIVGFHGQTIYHSPQEKISKQLGNGRLLSQLLKKKVVYNFRNDDIQNGGEGAPLSPLFHKLIVSKLMLNLPTCILNIGGISNITVIENDNSSKFFSKDIGPGNCLIDNWVRSNTSSKFDLDGALANKGIVNEIILEQAQELFSNRSNSNFSLDINDFDVSFVRGLSIEDGAATLTNFTAKIISSAINEFLKKEKHKTIEILICGGGRKNKILIQNIKKYLNNNLVVRHIDDYGINGDFVESQAFAFLAIRSILGLPISFPNTTGCKSPSTGGKIINY
tara:strand:- start:90 stop:1205 length:1116 start_codon:yes stop_codon:yes gene_type:complete